MVWGIGNMTSSRIFCPIWAFEGEPEPGKEGWRERLKAYYLEQTPEERKLLYDYASDGVAGAAHFYPGYVASKFWTEIGACSGGGESNPPVTPIKDHEPPRFLQTFVGKGQLGAFMGAGIYLVNEALKAIIERLEPQMHQFFPIEIRTPHNKIKIYPEPYYIIVISQYLDSFSAEKSDKESWSYNGLDEYFHKETNAGIAGLALSKAKFGNAHLWKERGMSFRLICLSNELQAEIAEAGLRFPKHYKMKEV